MLLCSDIVQIEWCDDRGVSRRTPAILEEINTSGALLLLDIEKPPRRADAVRLSPCGYAGKARKCQASASGFLIEVTFDPGVRWSFDKYLPSHLFDPQTLVARPEPAPAPTA
jgi:hypothetical protein